MYLVFVFWFLLFFLLIFSSKSLCLSDAKIYSYFLTKSSWSRHLIQWWILISQIGQYTVKISDQNSANPISGYELVNLFLLIEHCMLIISDQNSALCLPADWILTGNLILWLSFLLLWLSVTFSDIAVLIVV